MKAVVIAVCFCLVAVICSAASVDDTPKECDNEGTTYNETLCADICTKDPHKTRPYCENFSNRPDLDSTTTPVPPTTTPTSTSSSSSTTTSSSSTSSSTTSSTTSTTTTSPTTSSSSPAPLSVDVLATGPKPAGKPPKPSSGVNLKSSLAFTGASFIVLYVFM